MTQGSYKLEQLSVSTLHPPSQVIQDHIQDSEADLDMLSHVLLPTTLADDGHADNCIADIVVR